MIKIDVFIKNKRWKKYISNPECYLKNKSKGILSLIKTIKFKKINLSILLAGNSEIKKLNNKFRKKNKATDILSFPYHNRIELKNLKSAKEIYLGDIILNLQMIKKKNFMENFDKLWIHGFLHLLGYKHHLNKDFNKMNNLERKIYNKINKIND
tara:strand:- start:430 stop:891 length:462 start_codon:yes stop_codon:yes gene_type:complete